MPDTDPDPHKLPNFQAFFDYLDAQVGMHRGNQQRIREWAEKMKAWAEAAQAKIENLEDDVNAHEQVGSTLGDWEDSYRELRENVVDFARGLSDRAEFVDLVRDLRDEINHEGDWRKVEAKDGK